MYNNGVAVYRRLRAFRRLVLTVFILALVGSIACFVYTEIKYSSVSMAMSLRNTGNSEPESMNTDSTAASGNDNIVESKANPQLDRSQEQSNKKVDPNPSETKHSGDDHGEGGTAVPKEEDEKKSGKSKGIDFKKVLFIGNSITEGFYRWGDAGEATFYSMEGLNVNSFFNTDKFKLNNKKITPEEAVSQGEFEKIFLMFGINEIGWRSKEAFISRYEDVINSIKKRQPKAEIYVQSIIYVTEKRSREDKLFNNKNIDSLNQKIKKMAKKNNVEYIDLNKGICGDNNFLPAEASSDGIHLNPKYCKKWKSYLIEYFNE